MDRARERREPITGYRIYRSTSTGAEILFTSVGTATSYTDNAVVNGTTYFYQVTALNSVGEGARSNETSARPTAPASAPSAPTSSASAGNATVALTWNAPADGGSAITGYRVYRSTSSGTETLFASVGASTTSFTDSTVGNGVTYYYQVTALNSVGESARSNETSARPTAPATVPSAPTCSVKVLTKAGMHVSWTVPANGGQHDHRIPRVSLDEFRDRDAVDVGLGQRDELHRRGNDARQRLLLPSRGRELVRCRGDVRRSARNGPLVQPRHVVAR